MTCMHSGTRRCFFTLLLFWYTSSFRCGICGARGYLATKQAVRVAFGIAAGQFLVGPGAVYVGVWYWREGLLSSLEG